MFWAVAGAMSSAQLGITHGAGDPRRPHPRPVGDRREPRGVALPARRQPQLQRLPRLPLHDEEGRHAASSKIACAASPTPAIPEDEAFRAVEKYIVPMWTNATKGNTRRFWHEYFYELITDHRQRPARGQPRGVLAAGRGQGQAAHRRPRPRGLDLRQHLRLARQARRVQRGDRQVGHRVHGRLLRSVSRALDGRRLSASSRSAAASPATSRSAWCRRSSTTSPSRSSRGPTSARSPTRRRRTAPTRARRRTRRSRGTSSPKRRRCSSSSRTRPS